MEKSGDCKSLATPIRLCRFNSYRAHQFLFVAQSGRVLALEVRGRWIEATRADQIQCPYSLAVRTLAFHAGDLGSIPSKGSILKTGEDNLSPFDFLLFFLI